MKSINTPAGAAFAKAIVLVSTSEQSIRETLDLIDEDNQCDWYTTDLPERLTHLDETKLELLDQIRYQLINSRKSNKFDSINLKFELLKNEYFPNLSSEKIDEMIYEYHYEMKQDGWTDTPDGPLENE